MGSLARIVSEFRKLALSPSRLETLFGLLADSYYDLSCPQFLWLAELHGFSVLVLTTTWLFDIANARKGSDQRWKMKTHQRTIRKRTKIILESCPVISWPDRTMYDPFWFRRLMANCKTSGYRDRAQISPNIWSCFSMLLHRPRSAVLWSSPRSSFKGVVYTMLGTQFGKLH